MAAALRFARHTVLTLALAHLAAGCGGGGGGSNPPPINPPPSNQGSLQIAGKVLADSGAGGTSALPAAEVRVTIDRNANGVVDAGEAVTATSGADGAYSLQLTVTAGETAVVRFSKSGLAPVFRTLRAAPSTSVPVSATLRALDTLTAQGSTLAAANGSVSLAGLPAGATGSARVFNPVTETDAFPGDFSDSAGNRLVSGVFGTFEMRDGSGQKLEQLAAPATLKMRVPRDTWASIVDITSGNSQIDVPLYSFREATGEWVRDGAGHLEDGAGVALLPAALASLLDGTYVGAVYAVGQVSHFSTWNVDWPIASHGCVSGRVVDTAGAPVAGATVTVSGVSYTGTSTPVTVGADGRFCVEVMRSEGTSEDVDGDGVNGETSTVKIRVVSAGQVYDFGTRNLGTVNATCGGSACLDAGDLGLTADRRVTAGRCTVSGQVFLRDGVTPAAGAMVVAWDDVVPPELVTSLCFPSGQAPLCTFLGTAAADGSYSFTTASMGGLTLFANLTRPVEAGVTEYALAQRLLGDCPSPSAPVNLRLDEGFLVVQGQAGLAGDVISWTPATYPASFLWVMSGAGATKWMIQAAEGQPFPTPVTYGTLPSGAIQSLPASGAPAALASGDVITVLFAGTTADGSPLTGTAAYTVP